MTMMIECDGDPRAMGNSQGLVFRAEIQRRLGMDSDDFRRSRFPRLRGLTKGPVLGSGSARELIRHYTHLAERMAGMARNADVSLEALMGSFCDGAEAASPRDASMQEAPLLGAARIDEFDAGGIVRVVPSFRSADASWFVRKSRPEVGFDSVEVTQPWLPTAVGGVNEAGVAVAIVARLGESLDRKNSAPHCILFVQECLQRFEDVAGCVDWLNKRPHSGSGRLVLFDAAGDLVRAELTGGSVELLEGGDDTVRLSEIAGEGSPEDALLVLEPEFRRLTLRPRARPDEVLEHVELDH